MGQDFLSDPQMFDRDSLFYNATCQSLSPTALRFANDILAGRGLGVYMGWSTTVVTADANESALFFFDRALGLNKAEPINPNNPPPADWLSILGTMGSTMRTSADTGYNFATTIDNSVTGQLIYANHPDETLLTLIPSIASSTKTDGNRELMLSGSFGNLKGTVDMDGVSQPVVSWSSKSVTIQVPAKGGFLQVVSPLGLISNAFPVNGGPGQEDGTWFFDQVDQFPSGLNNDPWVFSPSAQFLLKPGATSYTVEVRTDAGQFDRTVTFTSPTNIVVKDGSKITNDWILKGQTMTIAFAGDPAHDFNSTQNAVSILTQYYNSLFPNAKVLVFYQ